jgi:ribosomal protein S18 acetylase RimI-like enzyme
MSSTTTSFDIRPTKQTDESAIETLWAERFGTADSMYGTDDDLIDIAVDPFTGCDIYIATDSTGELIAFTVGFVVPPAALHDWLGPTPVDIPSGDLNGFIQAIAVAPDWEHNGVASALLERSLTRFRDIGATHAHAVSWRRDDTVDSSALFEKFSFESLAHVEEFYARGDHPRKDCLDCTENPCTCDGTIYHKSI